MKTSPSASHVLYQHRQTGWAMLVVACVPMLCLCLIVAFTPASNRTLPPHLLLGISSITAVTLIGFATMSVRVTRDYLIAHFGIGLVRKTVALADIVDVTVVRTRWFEGWGIHRTRRGMLYNVSGFDAVQLRLASGKTLIVGSDDASRLAATLGRALAERRRGTARAAGSA